MKILVTGGAGYIGSVLVPLLLSKGHEVVVIDNFMYNQNSLLDCCYYKTLTIIRGDTRDEVLMKEQMKGVDFIFPLACLTGAPLCDKDPEGARSIVVDAVEMILKLRTLDQKIIYPTTNSGYGVGEKDKFCTEESALRPISLYGKVKVEAEKAILEAGNGITFRLATAFGVSPRMRLDLLVNDFTYRAYKDGNIELFESHFMRNYCHVRDISNAFIYGMENFEAMKGQPYNVGLSEANLSKWQLCEKIKEHIPAFEFSETMDAKDPDQRNYVVSNEKIEKAGFKAKVSLSDGINELIKAYRILDTDKKTTVHLTNIG